MQKIYAQALVILKAAPTYLSITVAILAIFQDELISVCPDAIGGKVTAIIGTTIAVLGATIIVIRRVTPVLPIDRGILPPPPRLPPSE